MLKHYFINKKSDKNGSQFMHDEYCLQIPKDDILYVGMFENCNEAIKVARENYSTVIGCKKCCSNCQAG